MRGNDIRNGLRTNGHCKQVHLLHNMAGGVLPEPYNETDFKAVLTTRST